MKVVFSSRAYVSVLAETTEKIKTETGGLFLGVYDSEIWYIIEAIDPGPKSIFEVAYFEYDQAYTQHLIRKTANLYDTELHLMGLWHRHPGSLDVFSSTDDGTNSKYAKLDEHGAISALVNIDPDFRITMYHVARPCKYSKIQYEVGDELIPERLMKFKTAKRFENIMRQMINPGSSKRKERASVSLASFLKKLLPYLDEYICNEIVSEPSKSEKDVRERMVNELIDDITFISDDMGIEITVLQREKHIVLLHESSAGITRLYYAFSEENGKLVFEYEGKSYHYEAGLFKKLFTMAIEEEKLEEAKKTPESLHNNIGKRSVSEFIRLFWNSNNEGDE